MSKKDEEAAILFTIFRQDVIGKDLVYSEIPDFIVTDPVNRSKAGIEITTVFAGQLSAITKSDRFLDGFIDHQLKGKKNKSDLLNNLRITEVENNEDMAIGYKGQVPWHVVTLNDYFGFIKELIESKSKSYSILPEGLQFVSLIAKDMDNHFKAHNVKPGVLYGLLRQDSLFEIIIESNFQEVYLISEFADGKYYFELKAMLFRCEFELFKKFWLDELNKHGKYSNTMRIILNNFCVCILNMGYKGLYIFEDAKARDFVFGSYCWKFDKETDTDSAFQFTSIPLPEDCRAEKYFANFQNYQQMLDQYKAFRKDIILHEDSIFCIAKLN